MSNLSYSDSGDAIKAIKDRISLVDVARRYMAVQQKGGRWLGLCPFHDEKTASFSINETEGFFYCFGCQAKGDLFEFYGRINGLGFKETLEALAEEAGIVLERSRRGGNDGRKNGGRERDERAVAAKMYELAKAHYRRNLSAPGGEACREYIAGRKLAPEIVDSFELGYSLPDWHDLDGALRRAGFSQEQGINSGLLVKNEKGRIYDRFRGRFMFPIKNSGGQTIAFGGRIIVKSDDAKYINSADSPLYKKGDNLYGLFQAKRSITTEKSVLLTEGYMDVLSLHQFGYGNACGVLGTALTDEQVRRMAVFCSHFDLVFDGDGAGRKAALRSARMILTKGLNAAVVLMPDGEDIDSLLQVKGREAFEKLRQSAPAALDFCIRVLRTEFAPKDSLDWVKEFFKELVPGLAPRFLREFCRGLDLDESELRRQIQEGQATRARRKRFSDAEGQGGNEPFVSFDAAPGLDSNAVDEAYARESAGGYILRDLPDSGAHTAGQTAFEESVLSFLARRPEHAFLLRDAGLEFVLTQAWTHRFFIQVMECGPDFDPSIVYHNLDDKGKGLWAEARLNKPPSDSAREAAELEDILSRVKALSNARQNRACLNALKRADGAEEMDLLKSIQDRKKRELA